VNDFLTRLLDAPLRATVRPVVRSVFEPGTELRPVDPVADDTAPGEVEARIAAPPRVADSSPRTAPAPPAPVSVAAPDERSAEPAPRRTPAPPLVSPRTGAPVTPAHAPRPQARPTPSVPRADAPPPPTPERSPTGHDAATEAPRAVTVHRMETPLSHPVQPPTAGAPVVPMGSSRAAPERTRPTRAHDHAVHVSIGRLEVRAPGTVAITPPRPERTIRRPPALSLSDYLSERNEGHR
jgi:hypothetical protein